MKGHVGDGACLVGSLGWLGSCKFKPVECMSFVSIYV